MAKPGWYMVCYDIADPKRLGKIHRRLKQQGIAAQKSVFFIQRDEKAMTLLLNELAKETKANRDDIRAYPVERPDKVWTTGGILETYPLVMPGRKSGGKHRPAKGRGRKKPSLWQRLLGR